MALLVQEALTADEVATYLEYIRLPQKLYADKTYPLTLELLTTLQAAHITTFPYENISLHYSQDKCISLRVRDIFDKFVRKHRGGYCMENNILLNHILCSLGFETYMTGARLYRNHQSHNPGWSGWEHAIIIVTIPQDKTRYVVDVGYGGHGPRCPLPLPSSELQGTSSSAYVIRNIGTQDMRLQHNDLDAQMKRHWVYQIRNSPEQVWNDVYAFTEIEFTHKDFEVMNFFTSKSPQCALTTQLLVVKFLRSDDDKCHVVGKVVLDQAKLKEYRDGKHGPVKVCESESERIQVLRDFFGIVVEQEDRAFISTRSSLDTA